MIPRDELVQMAARLADRTEIGEVKWLQSDVGVSDAESSTFFKVFVSGHKIEIGKATFEASPDRYYFFITRFGHNRVGSLFLDESDTDFEILMNLFSLAEREVVGWDKTLKDINEALDTEGPIGHSDPDEIPF